MTPPSQGVRRVWILTMAAAAVAATVFFLADTGTKQGGERGPAGKGSDDRTGVGLARLDAGAADPLLREEATLFDPTPLFLPTEWNAGHIPLSMRMMQMPGVVFRGYDPKLIYNPLEARPIMGAPFAVPEGAAATLAAAEVAMPFLGLGRTEATLSVLTPRQAVIEVAAALDGSPVMVDTLKVPDIPAVDWKPVEFLVAVDRMGLVGPPVLTARSGVETVDGFFQNHLARGFHIGERLPPGIYRITIGP